jgi:butyrate response factor 1
MGREEILKLNPQNQRKISCEDSTFEFEKSKDSIGNTSDVNYKTELCRTWVEKNFCPYKEKCRFAHGKKDLHDKMVMGKHYKQKECNSFYTKGFCPYGPRCHFKHEERRLDEINRPYYPYLLHSQANLEKLMTSCENHVEDEILYGSRVISTKSQQSHCLPVFDQIQNQHAPSPVKYDLPRTLHENIYYVPKGLKKGREFVLSRKILDSYM